MCVNPLPAYISRIKNNDLFLLSTLDFLFSKKMEVVCTTDRVAYLAFLNYYSWIGSSIGCSTVSALERVFLARDVVVGLYC